MVRPLVIKIQIGPWTAWCGTVAVLMAGLPAQLGSETLTLNTYYPSPLGVYRRIITTGTGNMHTVLARDDARVGIGNVTSPSYKLHVQGDVYADGGWLRVNGDRGWYNETHAGGVYMQDSTWVRTYNSKSFYSPATIRADGDMRAPIFYDQNDPSYYANPNGWSRMWGIQPSCYWRPFGNSGWTYCNDTGNERAVNFDYTGGFFTIPYGAMTTGTNLYQITWPTTGNMLCCRIHE